MVRSLIQWDVTLRDRPRQGKQIGSHLKLRTLPELVEMFYFPRYPLSPFPMVLRSRPEPSNSHTNYHVSDQMDGVARCPDALSSSKVVPRFASDLSLIYTQISPSGQLTGEHARKPSSSKYGRERDDTTRSSLIEIYPEK